VIKRLEVLPASIRLGRDKQCSLLCRNEEANKFYNIDTWRFARICSATFRDRTFRTKSCQYFDIWPLVTLGFKLTLMVLAKMQLSTVQTK